MKKYNEEKIQELMKSLDLTREEAMEIIDFDDEEFELDEVDEMTEKAKKIQKTEVKRGRKPKAEKDNSTKMAGVTQQKRAKKENPTKQSIINALEKAVLEELGIPRELVEVTNKEKTIIFKAFGETFEIDLKQKRKPKA